MFAWADEVSSHTKTPMLKMAICVFFTQEKMKNCTLENSLIQMKKEVGDTNFYCSSGKLYFNVGIDDRFGFDVERDWNAINQYLLLKKRMDKNCF